jgi:hypothetical protein
VSCFIDAKGSKSERQMSGGTSWALFDPNFFPVSPKRAGRTCPTGGPRPSVAGELASDIGRMNDTIFGMVADMELGFTKDRQNAAL